MGFESDKRWADLYSDQIKSILRSCAAHFIQIDIADHEADARRATDLVVRVHGGEIAVRLRSGKRDFRDWTIRTVRPGMRTEIEKLRAGFARWYLCGWTQDAEGITEWVLIDLDVVRAKGLLTLRRREFANPDGTKFVAIPVDELRRNGCVVVDRCSSPCQAPRAQV